MMFIKYASYRPGSDRIHKDLEHYKYYLEGFLFFNFTKIEAHTGIAEHLVRELAIEQALKSR